MPAPGCPDTEVRCRGSLWHHTSHIPQSVAMGNQYQDAFDIAYTAPVLPFAETVSFKIPVSKARRSHSRTVNPKRDTTWRQGIYLGRSVTSNETARSVRRFADASKRHNKELMDQMIGVPWAQGTTP